jgi:tRNA(Ile)-lysidine synthase TilS/MesJ
MTLFPISISEFKLLLHSIGLKHATNNRIGIAMSGSPESFLLLKLLQSCLGSDQLIAFTFDPNINSETSRYAFNLSNRIKKDFSKKLYHN